MISIKDFKVGETAYLMKTERTLRETELNPVEVVRVGNKYVTVKMYGREYKFETLEYFSEYALVEKVNAGSPDLLFISEQAYKDYSEKAELESWLRKIACEYGRTKFSLEQLRKVKAILEE